MSSSSISSFIYIAQQVTIYFDIPIITFGIVGNFLNVIIFLSLNTFRENSCAFYLTIMSIANIGQLLTSALFHILINGFNIDSALSSVFYCKFSSYCIQLSTLTSFTCMCLATIDQFLATCPSPRWQQWSNIKMAHHLTATFILIWLVHGIPYGIYYNVVISPTTNQWTCIITNGIFNQYHTYCFFVILTSIIPLGITILFGSLSYRNVQQLEHRTVPLVRREVEKQLSVMVFIHIVYNVIATVPFVIVIILYTTPIVRDPLINAQLSLAVTFTSCFYFLNFSVS